MEMNDSAEQLNPKDREYLDPFGFDVRKLFSDTGGRVSGDPQGQVA